MATIKKAPTSRVTVSGNKVTVKNTAGSRIFNSVKGIFIGLGVVVLCIFILGLNECNNVNNIRAYAEAGKNLVETGTAAVNAANEGRLVAVTGRLSFSPVSDSAYNVRVNSFVIKRVVEMYQWRETRQGSSTDEQVTYTYNQVWSSSPISSSGFYQTSGHENPAWPSDSRYQSGASYAEDAKLGDFTLTTSQVAQLPTNVYVTPPDGIAGMTRNGNYLQNYTGNPDVGSIRVSWESSNITQASALAKQSGTALVNYTTKNDIAINRIFAGDMTGADMVQAMRDANKMGTWFFRILLTILICIGFSMIFGPVNVLVSLVPFLGKYIGKVTTKVSQIFGAIIGGALSLVVILISWIAVRPIVAIPLLLIIGGVIALAVVQKKKNAALPEPAAAPAADGTWTCSCGQAGNTGKFCGACGKPQPEPQPASAPQAATDGTWTCSCGQTGNTGKFCGACGKPQQA